MPGRPRSKNLPGHKAGGARSGAGRKKKEEDAEPAAAPRNEVVQLAQIITTLAPSVTGRPVKINVELDNGQHVEIDLQAWAAAKQAAEADAADAADSPVGRSPSPQNDEDIDFYMSVDPDLNIRNPNRTTRSQPAYGSPTESFPLDFAQESTDGTILTGMPDFRLDRQSLAGPSNSTTKAATIHIPPLPDRYPNQQPAYPSLNSLQVALKSKEILAQALQAAVTASTDTSLYPLAGLTPKAVCGPFMPAIQTFGTQHTLRLKGPVELAPHHQIACYYAVYGSPSPDSASTSRLPNMSTSLADAAPFLQSDPIILFEQNPNLNPPLDAPTASVLKKIKRAPRKCLICKSDSCRGRGIRSLCPQYDPLNDEHLSRGGKRKRRSQATHPSNDAAQLDNDLEVDLQASPNMHLIEDMFTSRDMSPALFDLN